MPGVCVFSQQYKKLIRTESAPVAENKKADITISA
jgi:hypothetical protein